MLTRYTHYATATTLKNYRYAGHLKFAIFVQEYEVDFTPPFQRISMIAELERQLGVTFPPASTFASPGEYTMHSMFVSIGKTYICMMMYFGHQISGIL